MSDNINIERHKSITLNLLKGQDNFLNCKENNSNSIMEEYFDLFFSNRPHIQNSNSTKSIKANVLNEDNNHNELFNSYSAFFAYLIKTAIEIKCNITESITRKVATSFKYYKYPHNTVIIRNSNSKTNPFYVVLKGQVDLITPIQHQMQLYEKDYLRYLAYLIELEEYDIINSVLCDNSHIFHLEISNSNKFWKMIHQDKIENNTTPIYISTDNLLKELSVKERNGFYLKKANNRFLSEDYVNIIENIKKGVRYIEDKMISVKIYQYTKIRTLTEGNFFGYHGGGYLKEMINSLYITSKTTEFAYLDNEAYNNSIMPLITTIHKYEIGDVLTFNLFKGLAPKVFESKYANLIIKHQAIKGTKLIIQNENHQCIYFLKRADYEVTSSLSLKDIIEHITYLFETLQEDNKVKYQHQIEEILKEDQNLNTKRKRCLITNSFYNSTKVIKMFSICKMEVISSHAFCSKDNIYLFDFTLNSPEGEYYTIDKDIFNIIKTNENLVKQADETLLRRHTITIMKRLIEVYYLKLKYFSMHNKEIIKKINNLHSPTNQLKTILSIPKKVKTTTNSSLTTNGITRTSTMQQTKIRSRSTLPLVLETERDEPSYCEIKVLMQLPSVNVKGEGRRIKQTMIMNSERDSSCQTKNVTTSSYRDVTLNKDKEETLSFSRLINNGILKTQKNYFKNNKHNITGLIGSSSSSILFAESTNILEASRKPLVNSSLNFPTKKQSEHLFLHNTFKHNLFISNRKANPTSFLNYLTFKTIKPNHSINIKKTTSIILKYQQSLKKSISHKVLGIDYNNTQTLMSIKSLRDNSLNR